MVRPVHALAPSSLAFLLALPLLGCGSKPLAAGQTEEKGFELVCPSPIGDLKTQLVYTLTDDHDPVPTGTVIRYTISAPLAQV